MLDLAHHVIDSISQSSDRWPDILRHAAEHASHAVAGSAAADHGPTTSDFNDYMHIAGVGSAVGSDHDALSGNDVLSIPSNFDPPAAASEGSLPANPYLIHTTSLENQGHLDLFKDLDPYNINLINTTNTVTTSTSGVEPPPTPDQLLARENQIQFDIQTLNPAHHAAQVQDQVTEMQRLFHVMEAQNQELQRQASLVQRAQEYLDSRAAVAAAESVQPTPARSWAFEGWELPGGFDLVGLGKSLGLTGNGAGGEMGGSVDLDAAEVARTVGVPTSEETMLRGEFGMIPGALSTSSDMSFPGPSSFSNFGDFNYNSFGNNLN